MNGVVHPDESLPLAFVGGVHCRTHNIESMKLFRLQPKQRRHVCPYQTAQFADARARLGLRQQSLLLLNPYSNVDTIAAAAVQTIQEGAAALYRPRKG
jgi:hypothetical protein